MLWDDQTLEKRFNFWQKYDVGDAMHRQFCVNDITLERLSTILKQKICAFFRSFGKEQDTIGEAHVPFDNEYKATRHALLS